MRIGLWLLPTLVVAALVPATAAGAQVTTPETAALAAAAFDAAAASLGLTPPSPPPAPAAAVLSGPVWLPIGATLAVVFVTGAGIVLYLWFLQARFLAACRASGDLGLFARKPAGVPSGTVRSLLALFIVFASVAFLALSMLPVVPGIEFPEVMTGILGTVLGFYFGHRAADAAATPMTREARPEGAAAAGRSEPARAGRPKESGLDKVQETLRDGVAVARTAARVMPKEAGERLRKVADRIDQGLDAVDGLRRVGDAAGAAEGAEALAGELRRVDPVRDTLARASGSFAKALGGALPPLALAAAVVAIGARLAGAAYERWVARVLHAPYTPELFPAGVIDANTGFSLLLQCPILARAFAARISAGDRAFAKQLVERALSDEGVEALWREEAVRFADRAQFDEGVAEFQRAAIRQQVLKDVPADWATEAGGAEGVLAAVDRVHADPAARGDLDAIVLMADELRRSGRAPDAVFDAARAQLEQGS